MMLQNAPFSRHTSVGLQNTFTDKQVSLGTISTSIILFLTDNLTASISGTEE
uniref:Uncharacterized protein n=1 Tax=Arundo donax TaxID=35708 RepID=A0A0A8ZBF2_ARUDO